MTSGTQQPSRFDYDVVVVGSGFGGAVAALRLTEKGYRVLVLEAGRRFEDQDFAATSWDVRRYLWAPKLKCFGVQRIHRLPDVTVLAGAGVGGGSLNYANTLYQPSGAFYRDPQWGHITDWHSELDPHYATARRMLGVVESNPCAGPTEEVMRAAAQRLGVEASFRKTPVGVYFGEPGRTVPDPFFGGAGPDRTGCTECGNCMVGCRMGAKNTLMKNYLALAERAGVVIEALRTVTAIEPLPEGGFVVQDAQSGAWARRSSRRITAEQVVVAAGTWGTQNLLHRMRHTGKLPKISAQLGAMTRTNSEALGGAGQPRVSEQMELTKGVAITTSFHVDEHTHVENVRYGAGSNLMGLLSTLALDADRSGWRRVHQFVREFARTPATNLRAAFAPRWSERTVITLVMQSLDNSLTTSLKTRWGRTVLTSRQGHGAPNPSTIPEGQRAVRAIAAALQERSGQPTIAGASWPEAFGQSMTAHFLGGAPISDSPQTGVLDPYQRVWGYPGLHVFDGAAVSANLGVNPALTITAQAERAAAMWPRRGEADLRPEQGDAYVRIQAPAARVPGVPLGLPTVPAASLVC